MNNPSVNVALAWTIGRRFTWHGANRFAKFVSWVSMIGLTIGVMILTLVVSVMNGFDRELKTRLLDAVPHITVRSESLIAQDLSTEDVQELVHDSAPDSLSAVRSIAPYFKGFGALSNGGRVYPIGLYGIDPNQKDGLSFLRGSQYEGDVAQLPVNGIALSVPVARLLNVELGDSILVMGVLSSGDSVRPKMVRYVVGSIFQMGAESDYSLALVNLARFEPEEWVQLGEYGIQIQLDEPLQAPALVLALEQHLAEFSSNARHQLHLSSWAKEFGELFRAVQLEKSMMFLLLLLVVAIAAFNIVAGQTMVVSDKRSDIGILRTMGASSRTLQLTFLTQGIWVSVCGTLIGLLLGVSVAAYVNEILDFVHSLTGMHLLDGSLFVRVPVQFQLADLLLISLMSCGLCLLSAWIPARRAAQLDPVSNLH